MRNEPYAVNVWLCMHPRVCIQVASSFVRARLMTIASVIRNSVDLQKLDLEDELGVGWNNSASAPRAVAVVRGDGQLRLLAYGHLHDALVPSFDHLPDADGELEGLAAVAGGVELATVGERSCVVHCELVALLGERDAITGLGYLVCDSHTLYSPM